LDGIGCCPEMENRCSIAGGASVRVGCGESEGRRHGCVVGLRAVENSIRHVSIVFDISVVYRSWRDKQPVGAARVPSGPIPISRLANLRNL
jgi:hypothetical protein